MYRLWFARLKRIKFFLYISINVSLSSLSLILSMFLTASRSYPLKKAVWKKIMEPTGRNLRRNSFVNWSIIFLVSLRVNAKKADILIEIHKHFYYVFFSKKIALWTDIYTFFLKYFLFQQLATANVQIKILPL